MKKGIMFMLVIALFVSVMSVSALTITPTNPGVKVDGASSTSYYVLSEPNVNASFTLGPVVGEYNVTNVVCNVVGTGLSGTSVPGVIGTNYIQFTITPFEKKVLNWEVSCTYNYDNVSTTGSANSKTVSASVTNYVTTQKLLITEVDVDYDAQSSTSTSAKNKKFYLADLYNGDLSLAGIALEEDVTVEVSVANLLFEKDYDENSDAELSSVELSFEPDETSFFDEETYDFDDVKGISSTGSVRTKSVEVTFTAPIDSLSDSTSDSFMFVFDVLGVDIDDNEYEDIFNLELGFSKQKEKIYLAKSSFVNPQISCDDSAQMRLEFMNAGRSDEDEIMMYVYNEDLDYAYVEKNIDMDADTSESQSRSLTVDIPSDAKAGTYLFTIEFFTDNSESKPVDDSKYYVELQIGKCVEETTTVPVDNSEDEPSDIVVDNTSSDDILNGYEPVVVDTKSDDKEATNDVLLVVGLAGLNVVLLVVGVFLVLKILRK
ncbi:hypothetical protein JXM83_04815 [Candidatus Woesearchaeota archaeon]|nr:hypothetical protein [Candidatus Woesearchaeota archaeon]